MANHKRSSECAGYHQLTRRSLLKLGGVGLCGLALPELLFAAEKSKKLPVRAKSVILLHQFGGPSHHDTFDMKPNAPEAVRGPYKPKPTKVPGIHICERLPKTMQVADKLCIIRTMHHTMKNHNSATYYSLTGYAPPSDDQRLRDSLDLFPAYGSIVDKLAPAQAGMPSFVAYPYIMRDGSISPGQHASFLGKGHNPLFFTNDPNDPNFKLPELSLPDNISLERLQDRQKILKLIDEQAKLLEQSTMARGIQEYYQKAISMLTSPKVKKAFDLSAEPQALREKYGRTTYGQGCLLARRLVEAGVRFVNVYFASRIGGRKPPGGWDTHGNNNRPMYPIMKDFLLPATDQTLPTLLTDLDDRGLLKDTLVIWVGEFGRTPKINDKAGRDHWPQCYTAVLAGGGVKSGYVYGASDKNGAYPSSDPVRPDDLAATLFYLLGIDPEHEIYDPLNRPLPIAKGKPIADVIA